MINYLIKVILLLLVLTIINIINYNIGLILNYALQNW